ncbi:MAG: hypothetical protein LBT62_08570 [Deltaproteobacteria bacterium]|nr:hypothetical protein [Deltaproteobacteria bacterium]
MKSILFLIFMSLVLAASVVFALNIIGEREARSPSRVVVQLSPPPSSIYWLDKAGLAQLLGPIKIPATSSRFFQSVDAKGEPIFLETTIDPELQLDVDKSVRAAGAQKVALVVLDSNTGRILAISGRDQKDEQANISLSSFPAASVFKMVTAAAAVEKASMTASSTVAYDGAKHTLYKANLAKEPEVGVHSATLKQSFADSINSVFGKLGMYSFEPQDLSDFAGRFGFNVPIGFELPLESSVFDLELPTDETFDDFRLAELASGFNRQTKLSPIHGALMAASIANGGELLEPTVIIEAFDRDNNILYRGVPKAIGTACSPQTASELSILMEAAVTEGTGRKGFSDMTKNSVLSKLAIGGKSGSINDDQGARVDWFVAYARRLTDPSQSIALAAVVVHDGFTKTTSQELVREALLSYYGGRLNEDNPQIAANQQSLPETASTIKSAVAR